MNKELLRRFFYISLSFSTFVLICILLSLFFVPIVSTHQGPLDIYGGHFDRQSGKYHFHRGALAGKAFASREDALSQLYGSESAITLGSFNIRIFSNRSRSDKELAQIVTLLKDFDIVAIQELRDEQVMSRTKHMLEKETGAEWESQVSAPVGRGVKERYAFLYRKDKILPKVPGKVIDDVNDRFIREPFYATFRAGFFDFTLINYHAIYKSPKAPERLGEFIALKDVFGTVQEADPTEKDLIIIGDFNEEPTSERFNVITSIPGIVCVIQPPAKTTIKDTNLYDNICFQKGYVSEYKDRWDVIKFDETLFRNNDKAASLAVSDHRPIYAVFSTDKDDD